MEDDESTEKTVWLTLLENLKPRTLRVIPKVYRFVENVIPLYNDTDFRRDFRIRKITYETLIAQLNPVLLYIDNLYGFGQESITVQKQVLVFLWYIAKHDSMGEIGKLFGVAKSTVCKCTRRVSQALFDLRKDIIKWPDLDRQQEISESLETTSKVPNVISFIDGTHIRLTQCPHADYINRKGFTSVNVQIVADDRLMVIDVYLSSCQVSTLIL